MYTIATPSCCCCIAVANYEKTQRRLPVVEETEYQTCDLYSIQLTAFNQPSAITVIASVGHAPVTSEPNDGDPKTFRDTAPSAAIVEFLLYDTQRLELEGCAVRSDTACTIQLVVAVFLGGLLVVPKFTMKFVVRHACDAIPT